MKAPLLQLPCVLALAAFASPAAARAGNARAVNPDAAAPKGTYSIFNPVPQDKLREFDSDRPDQATGPHTVDAGHVQVEMDFVNYARDRHNAQRTPTDVDQWNVAPVSVRVGVLPNVELDFQYDGYYNLRTRDRAARPTQTQTQTQSGFGAFGLRSKINLAGNDDGARFGLGLFPSVRFPTSTADLASHSVEGGLGVAVAVKLPGDFSVTASADFQFVRNSTDSHYVADYLDAISVSHGLGLKGLSAFVEFASEIRSESPAPAACQVDAGLIYQVSENVQLDVDCNFGVTRAADDFTPFAGLSVRF